MQFINTRPDQRAKTLSLFLRQHGVKVIDLPLLTLVEKPLTVAERAVLQTINRYMQPQELRLLRIDNKFKIRNEIVYCKDTCSIVDPNHDLDEDTLRVIELMQDSEAVEHTHQTDDGFISFFEIMNSNHRVIYIKIMNTHSISRQNRNLLLGLIEIFKN